MRIFILLAISLIASCSTRTDTNQQAMKQVSDFYAFYLPAIMQSSPPDFESQEMHRYVSVDTLNRLASIQKIPEQEILGSNYFTYTQDYDLTWIPALKVGPVHDLMGGKVVNVRLGVEDGKTVERAVYVRLEQGVWKIYRVQDMTNNYEAPIFDAGRIKRG